MLKALSGVLLFAVSLFAADVSGTWNVTAQSPNGRTMKTELILKQEAGKVTGSISSDRGEAELVDGKIEGNDFTFKLNVDEGYSIKLVVAGETMKGTATTGAGEVWQLTAVRPGKAGS